MSFSQRFEEIRTGFERPFWIANISELFERLSYYAVFAVLARYLHEGLHFDVQRASSLTGMFGGWVWIIAVFGGADKPFPQQMTPSRTKTLAGPCRPMV